MCCCKRRELKFLHDMNGEGTKKREEEEEGASPLGIRVKGGGGWPLI